MKPGKISPVLYVILGVSIGLFGFFLILANPFGWKITFPLDLSFLKSTKQNLPKGIKAAPTPYLFLPTGKQTYNAQGGRAKSTATSITFDPLDPEKNTTQTISATIESLESVKSVSLIVNTDTKSNTYPMQLSSGNKQKGVWVTRFQNTDTFEKIYNIEFVITNNTGNKISQPMLIR